MKLQLVWISSADFSGYRADLHEGHGPTKNNRSPVLYVWIRLKHERSKKLVSPFSKTQETAGFSQNLRRTHGPNYAALCSSRTRELTVLNKMQATLTWKRHVLYCTYGITVFDKNFASKINVRKFAVSQVNWFNVVHAWHVISRLKILSRTIGIMRFEDHGVYWRLYCMNTHDTAPWS